MPKLRHVGAAALALAAVTACQLAAKLNDRSADPLDPGCHWTSHGAAFIRIANLRPSDERFDVCLRATGGAFARPLFRGSGVACPAGLSYLDVTNRIPVAAGQVDVRVVAYDDHACASPVAELAVDTRAGSTTTLFVAGRSKRPPRLFARPETGPAQNSETKIRLVNALDDDAPLLFGVAGAPRLPAHLNEPFGDPVAFGDTLPRGLAALGGAVDLDGYIVTSTLLGAAINLGAVSAGATAAIVDAPVSIGGGSATLFAVGDATSSRRPIRGLLCSEASSDDLLVTCAASDPASLTVEVYYPNLVGVSSEHDAARLPLIEAAITAGPPGARSDVLCLTEVGPSDQRQSIASIAARPDTYYPFAARVDETIDTPPIDATDQTGAVPPPPAAPPCAGDEATAALDVALTCARDNCADGTDTVRNAEGACPVNECAGEFLGLGPFPSCFQCVYSHLAGYVPLATIRESCRSDARPPLAFDGQSPRLILSHFPIVETSAIVLPSTGWRRDFVRARIQASDDVLVDVYCGRLSTVQPDYLPYSGAYGGGSSDGWSGEQRLQLQRLIAAVSHPSGPSMKTIVMGNFDTSEAYVDPTKQAPPVGEVHPDLLAMLRGAFIEAVPEGFLPRCNYCKEEENPYNTDVVVGNWTDRIFMLNVPASAAVDASYGFQDRVFALPNGKMAPLSNAWSYRVSLAL